MNIVIAVVLMTVNVVTSQDAEKITKCDDIPLQNIDFEAAQLLSPFNIYRSNDEIYNCSQASVVSYAGKLNNYTGTVIVVNKKQTAAYDVTLVNGNVFRTTRCSDGWTGDYHIIYSHLKDHTRASYCVVLCDHAGYSIQNLICGGRTAQDEMDIHDFLKTLTIPMAQSMYYNQQNCQKPQHCISFPL